MSTKHTLYWQEGKRPDVSDSSGDYIHVYWDMDGHAGAGLYIDISGDPSYVADGKELVRVLNNLNFDNAWGRNETSS